MIRTEKLLETDYMEKRLHMLLHEPNCALGSLSLTIIFINLMLLKLFMLMKLIEERVDDE